MRRTLVPLVIVSCLAACGAGHSPASSPTSGPVRCEADGGFSTPNDKGALVDVPDPTSRATVVEMCASWCKGCEKSVPALLEHRAQLEADGVRVVLLGVLEDGESIDDTRSSLASWGVSDPFLIDRGGVLMRRYGFSDLPASVVLDAKGNVRWTSSKDSTLEDLEAAAREAARSDCPSGT